jgi:PHD/YefM family antitoxin component YafN of YafNO toxin-antitoxin module
MAYGTFEDFERLARTNEDRFEQIETELNRALELIGEGNVEKAQERIDQAAHMAGVGLRLNLVATQK